MTGHLTVTKAAVLLAIAFGVCSGQGRPCVDKPIDLVFILDSSWSLRSESNFKKELEFVADVVTALDFSKSRVSIITFSDSATLSIPFDQYSNVQEFQRAVRALPWVGGNTYTNQALDMMLNEVASNRNFRAGTDVATMGVIITDGGSTDPYKTEDVVKRVHSSGIEMFAIGVGEKINDEELMMIATDPDVEHKYMVDSLDALPSIRQMLSSRFCQRATTQAPPSNLCQGKPVDIVFVLDSSWSLRYEENFQKELKFVSDVVNSLRIDLAKARLSVITFSDEAKLQIPFALYNDRRDFQAAVLQLPWIGGNTYTNKALEMMLNEIGTNRNFRQGTDALTVGVVVTDGGSTDPYRTENVVRKMHSTGIEMFAIGVGEGINTKELEMIASKPTTQHLFMVDDLDGLNMLQIMLANQICPGPLPPSPNTTDAPPTPSPNTPANIVCDYKPADIFFIVDKSSSLRSKDNFYKELGFVARIIDDLNIGISSTQSRVGVISFSTDAKLEFGLDAYRTKKEVQDSLLYVEFSMGNTYTHKALNIMLDGFKIARRNVRLVGIIITDGQSTDPYSLRDTIERVKRQNIEMFAIGVGDSVNRDELELMASQPPERHVSHVENLDALSTIQLELNLKTCR